MDINKWKSVAIKKEDYLLLKGLCKDKFRAPGGTVSYTHLTLPTILRV